MAETLSPCFRNLSCRALTGHLFSSVELAGDIEYCCLKLRSAQVPSRSSAHHATAGFAGGKVHYHSFLGAEALGLRRGCLRWSLVFSGG